VHDEILDLIVANAFNGFGDSTGSDDFGYSVAWLDLQDYLEDYENEGRDTFELTDLTTEYMGGLRWILAYIDADGTRSAVGYDTHEDMMIAYRDHEKAFLAFEETREEDC
jgi:hypothetical protein